MQRPSLEEMIACAEREVRQRRRVYPRLVDAGKMTQAFADRQIALMEAIAADLRERLQDNDLFGGAA